MAERDEVLSILKHEIIDLKERFGVRRIGLFGSIIRNEASDKSDIDILVELDPASISYRKYLDFEIYLQSFFSRTIDIVTTDGLSPYIYPYISREVIWV